MEILATVTRMVPLNGAGTSYPSGESAFISWF